MKKTLRLFKKRNAHNPINNSFNNPNTPINMRQNDSITEASEAAILKFYAHFCDYMTRNFNADPEELMLDWNCVGATARFIAKGRNIQYRLWERSEGHMGIPDMTAIVYEFSLAPTGNPEKDQETILRLHGDLAYMAYTAGFRHYAFIRKKPLASPKQVPGCEVACIRLG